MLLVFLFILVIFILMLLLSQIKINIKYINISNVNIKEKIRFDFLLKIGLYLFGKIRLIEISLDKKKVSKSKMLKKIDKRKLWDEIRKNKSSNFLKKIDYTVDTFNLESTIGTEDAALTSYIVGTVAIFIGILMSNIIKQYNSNKQHYKLIPVYGENNILDFKLNTVIYIRILNNIRNLIKTKQKAR